MQSQNDWRKGSGELFGLYVEVGKIQPSALKSEKCNFVECWISSYFHKNCLREECASSSRRPIYSFIEYIENLCVGENSCVLIMEDDTENAIRDWHTAIYLIVKYLKRIEKIKSVMIFTKQTAEEINTPRRPSFCSDFEIESRDDLYKLVDVCFTERSNVFVDSTGGQVVINTSECEELAESLLHN